MGGLFKLLVALLGPSMLNLFSAESDLIIVLGIVGDACFRFIPVFVAYSAAKHFEASVPLALILSRVLLSSTLIEIVKSEQALTVYGIPMIATDYANQFLPSLLIVWILAKVIRSLSSGHIK